jgi:uncharacterized protein (TIGR01777 family)
VRVLISGATGMIGAALADRLTAAGHEVIALTRRASRSSDIPWDPSAGRIDAGRLEGFDAVVHLAGESLASGRWTPARKREFRSSRVGGTDLIARTLAERARKPGVLVSVSAIGIYGDRGDETLDESSPPGNDFLSELAVAWEAAATPAEAAGIRVVHPRIGLALSPDGGALAALLPTARLGLGGPLGSGRQWWSWVTLDDVVSALATAIDDDRMRGPVNVVAPEPVRQREFARTLGRVLGRPAFVPAPGFALRILLGEMADTMLLAGQRVKAAALEAAGFRFRDPGLEPALRRLLGRA